MDAATLEKAAPPSCGGGLKHDRISPAKNKGRSVCITIFSLIWIGTLTDSKEGILNSLRYAFDKLGEPVPPESTLIKFIGPPLQDSFAEFCGFSAERAAEAIAAFRERYEPVGKFENMAAPGMADLCAG